MNTIIKGKFLLVALALSLAVNATASEFIYKPASPTVAAVNLQGLKEGTSNVSKNLFKFND